jgi:hypothetical protein
MIRLPVQRLPKNADNEATPVWCTGTQFADYLCTTSWKEPSRLARQLLSKPYIQKVPVSTLGQRTCHPDKLFLTISNPLVEFWNSTSIRRQLFSFPFQFIIHQSSHRRYILRSYQLRNIHHKSKIHGVVTPEIFPISEVTYGLNVGLPFVQAASARCMDVNNSPY